MKDGRLGSMMRANIATALFVAIAMVFVMEFVMPLVLAALFRTNNSDAVGRIGLLGPVVVIADTRNRFLLYSATLCAVMASSVACFVGTLIGLGTSGSGGWFFRLFRFLTFFPGRAPAWVMPACLGLCLAGNGSSLSGTWSAGVWVLWVSWWGATRVAMAFAAVTSRVPQSEFDASRILERSPWLTIRTVLKPRVADDFRLVARYVVFVMLFDPSPAIFLGVKEWPAGKVLGLIRLADAPSAVEASSWILWLVVIALGISMLIRLCMQNRDPIEPLRIAQEAESPKRRPAFAMPVSPWFRVFAYAGAWPIFLFIYMAVAGYRVFGPYASGFMRTQSELSEGFGGLERSSFVQGLLFSVSTAIILVLLARNIDFGRWASRAKSLVSFWSPELAFCSLAIGRICSEGLVTLRFAGSAGGCVPQLPAIALAVYVLARMGDTRLVPLQPASVESVASFEASLTLGLPRRTAELLRRRSARRLRTGYSMPSLILSGWWLVVSPAWAFVPMWRVVPVPVVGQILARSAESRTDAHRFALVLGAILMTAALISFLGVLVRGSRCDNSPL